VEEATVTVDESEQSQEDSKFVHAALFLKKAGVKLNIPLFDYGPSPTKIDVDSARRSKRVRRARAADEHERPQQPAPGRPAGPRPRAKMGPHTRRCNVCRHPHRKDIEDEFLRWRSPDRIAQDYKIPDHSSIYRHVHATGIFARRRKAVRAALEPIIECAQYVKVTSSSLVKAVHAYAHINEHGEWVNHPTQHTVIVQHINVSEKGDPSATSEPPSPAAAPPVAHPATKDSPSPPPGNPQGSDASAPGVSLNSAGMKSTQLNRQIQEVEHAPTPSKQRKATSSNRQKIQKWISAFLALLPSSPPAAKHKCGFSAEHTAPLPIGILRPSVLPWTQYHQPASSRSAAHAWGRGE
jgi:hypothetical protein